jgi:N-acetylneuraminic acid mutarotase
LSISHSGATSTLLADGRVLVVGGLGPGEASTATAEIYDPATGTWSTTGDMTVPRSGHTATRLPNGKVLVAGGFDQQECYPDCAVPIHQTGEIYDPGTGAWTFAGYMTGPRFLHTATLLNNGRVLLVGGACAGVLSTAEIYNPAAGTWIATRSMASHRFSHTATRLGNGGVLVAAGYGVSNTALTTAEVYNPATGKWTLTGNLGTARGYHGAVRLLGGKVLVTGGVNVPWPFPAGFPGLAETELYDPATGIWSATGSMTTPRFANTLNRLQDGTVLAAGGEDKDVSVLKSSETYDPSSGMWTAGPDMSTPRASATGTLLLSGQVLVASGFFINNPLVTAELYVP